MKTLYASLLALLLTLPVAANAAADVGKARVCTTLGKVHAQRERQLYAVEIQSIDGRHLAQRGQACIHITAGEHTLGMTAAVQGAGFPKRRTAQGGLREQKLTVEFKPRHTYYLAAQLEDRFAESWIPMVERVEAW
jgi:hypothetical protein